MSAQETIPAWQKGYDLAFLKGLTKLFKDAYKPYAHGAFSTPNEAAVADALSKKRLTYVHAKDKIPIAAAIHRTLDRPATREDFTGRERVIPAGAVLVEHVAGLQPDVAMLLKILRDRHKVAAGLLATGAAPMWVEINEENPEVRAVMDRMGYAYSFTTVKASSDLRGVYCLNAQPHPPLPPVELLTLCRLKADFITPVQAQAVLNEAERSAQWAQHYSSYNKGKTWTAFALRGYVPDDPTFIIKPAEMSKKWKEEHADLLAAPCEDTVAAARFPAAMAIAARIPGRKDRVRLMRLAADGGELTRHADITDRDAGTDDGKVVRLHIPLRTSPQVEFNAWNARGERKTLRMEPCGLYYLDQRKPHAVVNHDPSVERIHLVVDVYASPQLRKVFPDRD